MNLTSCIPNIYLEKFIVSSQNKAVRFFVFWIFVVFGFSITGAMALCVDQEQAKLRQGPGTNWNITWEVVRYFPLEKLAKKNGWYRVKDVDGIIHWIREDLVTTSFSCAIIKGEFANLRTGPGRNFAKAPVQKGEKYLSFRVIGKKADWIHVEDQDGDQAWIQKDGLWIP